MTDWTCSHRDCFARKLAESRGNSSPSESRLKLLNSLLFFLCREVLVKTVVRNFPATINCPDIYFSIEFHPDFTSFRVIIDRSHQC